MATVGINLAITGTAEVVSEIEKTSQGIGRATSSWVQNMKGVQADTDAAAAATTRLSSETQKLLGRYDPLGAKLRSLKDEYASLYDTMAAGGMRGNMDVAQKALIGLQADIVKTKELMATAGVEGFENLSKSADKSAFATAGAKRELMVLGHEAMTGNFSRMPGSFMVLAERMSLTQALFSPLTLGFGGLAVAAVGVGVAMAMGAAEQKGMNNALLMTGNYAGLTSDSLHGLAVAAAGTAASLGEAKKVATELAGSGKYSGEQIGLITGAVVAMEHATGVSTEHLVKQFETLAVQAGGHSASMSQAISQATLKLDEEYHFLTLSVYNQILALEKEGDAKAASALATQEFARTLKERSAEAVADTGHIADAWNTLKRMISLTGDELGSWGKKSTAASEVAKAAAIVASLQPVADDASGTATPFAAGTRGALELEAAERKLVAAQAELTRVNERALDQQAVATSNQRELNAGAAVDAMLKSAQAHSQDALTAALKKYHEELDKLPSTDARNAPDTVAAAEAALKKQFGERAEPKSTANPFAADQEAAKEWAKSYETLSKLAEQAEAKTLHLSKAQEELAKYLTSGAYQTNSQDMRMAIVEEGNLAIANEEAARAAEAQKKAIAELDAVAQKELDQLDAKIKKQTDSNEQMGMTKAQIDALNNARQLQSAQADEEYAQVIRNAAAYAGEYTDAYIRYANALDLAAAKKRELARLDAAAGTKQDALDASKAWKKTSDEIERNITDALMRGFESGKGIAQTLRDTIVNMFKTMVLRPIVSAVVNVGTQGVASALGMSNAAGGSGIVNGINAGSSLNTAYGAASQYLYGGTAGASSASLAYANSVGMAGGDSLGALAVANGQWAGITTAATDASATWAATAATAENASLAFSAGATSSEATAAAMAASEAGAATAGTAAAGAGITGVLAAIPVWGWAALAAITVASIFGGGGPKKTNSTGIEGRVGSDGLTANSYANWSQDGGWFGSDSSGHDTSALAAGQSKQFSTAYTALQMAAASAARSLGLSAAAIGSYSEAFQVQLTGDATKDQALITKLFSDLGDHLASAVAPGLGALAKDGETAGTTLLRLASSITVANAWLSMLHNRLFDVSMAGANAASKLADAFGGLTNLTTASQAFYDLYYTDGEKAARAQADMAQALATVNLALPTSKDGLKALANTLDLNTDAGRAAYAVLLAIAPVFSATADAIAKLASDAATKLMATFTASGQLPGVLDSAKLKMDGLATSTGATTGALTYINRVMGDAASGVISFGAGSVTLATGLSASQLSAGLLNDQLVALQDHADKTRIDFVGLSTALAGVNTETFVATVGLVFVNLAKRVQGTIDAISTERAALASAALQIINPTVLSKTAIAQGVAGVSTVLPSNAGILAAANSQNKVQALQAALDQSNSNLSYATHQGTVLVDAQKTPLADAQALLGQATSRFNYLRYGAGSGNYSGDSRPQDIAAALDVVKGASADLEVAQAAMAAAQAKAAALVAGVKTVPYTQSYVDAQNAAAVSESKTAQLAYAAAMQSFALDAGKSVGKLTTLREETVKYYNAQKQLADLMTTSAAGLRSTVAGYNFAQKTPQQQLADLQSQYSAAYSTAMSVQGDGATLAGYGDKLNALLSPLIAKLQETGNQGLISSYLAQADSVAALIEKVIPVNYQQDSLDMLSGIDATLAALDSTTQSAETIISAAVAAGADKTALGLHAVIAALTGQAIPAFATGGNFAGGLRIVGENGPELEATGPSRIFSAAQTRSMLQGGAGGNTARLEALVEALTAEVASLRIEARATAVNTAKSAKQLDRLAPAGDALQTRAVA